MLRNFSFFLFLSLFVLGCGDNDRGDQLFQVVYDPVSITIPAGRPAFATLVVADPSIETGILRAIQESETDIEAVDEISGRFARLVSVSGEDFRELERLELRLCPVGQNLGCDQFDLLFSVDDLFGRRQQVVNLNPGLKNFRNLLLGNEQVRFELVITPGQTTTRSIEARLEWAVAGVGGL